MKTVKFKLNSLGYFNNINIPEEERYLFPVENVEFTLKNNVNDDIVKVMSHPPKRPHIHLTTTMWFKKYRDQLKKDEQLIIEVTESKSGREYRLDFA
jgi:hypothetical protein